MRKLISKTIFCIFLTFAFLMPSTSALESDKVVVVELSGEIDHGQTALVIRGFKEAQEQNAKAFILQMDTFGGLVAAATSIRDNIGQSDIPTICYIKNRAWSAGALIALSHKYIVMAPGGSIGAAEPIPTTEKSIAAVKAEFAATAQKAGRDPRIAEAMVDKTLGYKEYAKPGQILALTDYQAKEVGYADFIAENRSDLLKQLGFEGVTEHVIKQNWQEKLTGIIESPAIKSVLLSIIIIAIITEIKTAGLGIGAAVAVIAAILLYGGSFLTGASGWLEPVLFFVGLALLFVEFFIPGFGIFGIAGIGSIFASFFFILGGDQNAVFWLAISIIGALVLFLIFLRNMPSSKLWNRFVLKNTSSKEDGFDAAPDFKDYLGKIGTSTTQLRPAGMADFDGEKMDVLTYGEFVEVNKKIIVINVEGNKLFVKVFTE